MLVANQLGGPLGASRSPCPDPRTYYSATTLRCERGPTCPAGQWVSPTAPKCVPIPPPPPGPPVHTVPGHLPTPDTPPRPGTRIHQHQDGKNEEYVVREDGTWRLTKKDGKTLPPEQQITIDPATGLPVETPFTPAEIAAMQQQALLAARPFYLHPLFLIGGAVAIAGSVYLVTRGRRKKAPNAGG